MTGIPTIEHYPLPANADLPDNVVPWRVDPARATLLVHDMQGYFMRPFPESIAEPLVRNIGLLRERATATGMRVAYTAQPGGMTDEQRGLLRDFWGPGMRADATDKRIIDRLAPGEGDWVLTKWRYSAFFGSDLLDRMRAAGRDQMVLCGIYAHVGVLMTAVESFTNDIETFLVADAIADFTPEFHRLAVDYAASRCAVVTTAKEVLG